MYGVRRPEEYMMNFILRKIKAILPRRRRVRGVLSSHDIARRYSRGNVNIQLGRIVFESEYQKQKERVLAYDFR